jgi:hypothetical protein
MKLKAVLAALAVVLSCAQANAQSTAAAALLPPGKQCFQATAGLNGMVGTLGPITGGNSYANGTYGGVSLLGGSGSNATANITVSGGAVTSVSILNPGAQYVVGDVLSAAAGDIGGSGSGFSVPVLSTSINSSLAGGSVGYYIPSTLTIKQTWQDAGETILNQNPVPLDQNGCAVVYGNGTYRQIVKDSLGNTVWDQPTSSSGAGGSTPIVPTVGDGLLVGTVLPWSALVAPPNYQFAYGQELSRVLYPELLASLTIKQNVVCVIGSNVLTGVADTSQIPIGAIVEASCVPPGSAVTARTSTSLTISTTASTSTNVLAQIFPYGDGDGALTFNVPDYRGATLVGRNNMGGPASSRLGPDAWGSVGYFNGSERSSLLRSDLPNVSIPLVGTPGSLSVTSTIGTIVNSPAVQGINSGAGSNFGGLNNTGSGIGAVTSTGSFTPAGSISLNGGVTQTTFGNLQPSITANYIIKVTPDVSSVTLYGVASIAGMQGVLNCGPNLVCSGNTIDGIPSPVSIQSTATYNTLADFAASVPLGTVNTVYTLGRNYVGDNGGASYTRISPSTAAPWRVQTGDGQWWAINNRTITPEMFGAEVGVDSTSVFASIATWLNNFSGGGATLNFTNGRNYIVWPAGTHPSHLMDLSGINGLTINYNSAKITTNNLFGFNDGPKLITFANCTNVIVNNTHFEETAYPGPISPTDDTTVYYIRETSAPWSRNFQFNNNVVVNAAAFLEVASDMNGDVQGISAINTSLKNVYYGFNFQGSGDNFFGRGIKCDNCGRVYFPWNVSNHDVEIIGNGGGPFNQNLLKAYAYPNVSQSRDSLSNIRLVYKNPARVNNTTSASLVTLALQQVVDQPNVSGAANNGSGAIRLTVDTTANMATGQTWFVNSVGGVTNANGTWTVTVIDGTHVDLVGSTFAGSYMSGGYLRVPASLRNIDIILDVDNDANQQPPAVLTYKNNADGTVDTTTNGYVIENIGISGSLKNYNWSIPAIDLFYNDSISTGTWVGETINNVRLHDLTITGAPSSYVAVNGLSGTNFILENIQSPVIPWTVGGALSSFHINNINLASGPANRNTVIPVSPVSHQFVTGIDSIGTISQAQPTVGDISGFGAGISTFLATPSSANLAAAVTGETGSGSLVFATSPSLTTPSIGAATATSVNKVAFTAPATAATLTIANNKTATISNTLTFTGTDGETIPFGAHTRQVFTTGSGTYTTPTNVKYLSIRMVGAGGGGAGGGTGGGTGGNATATTFGSSFLTANGGSGGAGAGSSSGGNGGVASGGAPNLQGGSGAPAQAIANGDGGQGAASPFGGSGNRGTTSGAAGTALGPGSGGGGGGNGSGATGGGGGGAGGYLEAIVTAPNSTYVYAVGSAGSAGTAGTNGNAGAAGSAGIIIVDEFYQ